MNSKSLKFAVALILLFTGMSLQVIGQTERKVDCGSVAKIERPKNNRIVSFGVINARAIDLVTPEFPASARAVKVHGPVEISVVIDTRGCVNEAKALSGHPLLISASIKAALKSSFSPITLSGNPIWVNGVITYNYIADSLSWFELGLFSDSAEKLYEFLPSGFELQREEVRRIIRLPYDEMRQANMKLLDRIRVELTTNPKEQWLFDMGRKLNEISKYNWIGIDGLTEKKGELQQLLEIAPDNVSKKLRSRLNDLIKEPDSTVFWTRLKEIELRAPDLGK